MSMELSLNAQAILMLTAPLILGKRKETSVRPLNLAEYNRLARCLKEYGREPADLLSHDSMDYLPQFQMSVEPERLHQLLTRGFLLSQVLERWRSRLIWTVTRADTDYPQRLKRRLGEIAPPVLYGCGDRDLLDTGGLAVVGSRNADDVEIEYAERIGRMAAEAKCTVMSGGARGIDRAAMTGALQEGGIAVGVLADGLENAVMNRENREILMDGRIVLVSPYDPRSGFNVGNAMARNKLIYALADAGLVVASDNGTGGTWNGAIEQLGKMRLVPVYARADADVSEGLRALQRKGALEWPNPRTPEDFTLALKGPASHSLNGLHQQGTFLTDTNDVIPTRTIVPDPDITPSLLPIPPADALFAKVAELLKAIDSPITDSDVATYLVVSKNQAKDWLKRLEQEGIYQKLTKPVRYVRTSGAAHRALHK